VLATTQGIEFERFHIGVRQGKPWRRLSDVKHAFPPEMSVPILTEVEEKTTDRKVAPH
jgi:hypothetical protein